MKKLFVLFFAASILLSCDKNALQQTTDHMKRADSLLTKANDGLKTLDSISKTISQSGEIVPEIEKHRKAIDSTIKSGSWQIDSINQELEKITNKVGTGTDVVKTLDSAKKALDKGENPMDILTKTADKILKKTKTAQNPTAPAAPQAAQEHHPSSIVKNPLVKSGKIEILVNNITDAKALLKQKIRANNADLITENFSQNEGVETGSFEVKVPLQKFEQLVNDASALGEIRMKNTNSEGSDYQAAQLCDVEITLTQNEKMGNQNLLTGDNVESSDDSGFGAAFMKGFKVLGDGLILILPFWPIFLLALLVVYFVRRNRQKTAEKELEKQQLPPQQPLQTTDNQNTIPESTQEDSAENNDTDYSKYMPKK